MAAARPDLSFSSSSSSSNVGSVPATPTFLNQETMMSSDGESSGYSMSDLLTKKKKNSNSSDAQKYMHVS